MKDRLHLEVCVDSGVGLSAALRGGADRIELCAALEIDGLTPSSGLMAIAARADKPVYAMIRPRAGDFVYDQSDIDVMLRDIDAVRRAGLSGVVLGANLPCGELDMATLRRLTDQASGLGLTLHRAIDLVADPIQALDEVLDLGFERVLTSGGGATAEAGADMIANMVDHARGRLSIMAGSGVTPFNVAALLQQTNVREIHSSCSRPVVGGDMLAGTALSLRRETRAEIVSALVAILDQTARAALYDATTAGSSTAYDA